MKVTVRLFASFRKGRFAIGVFDGEAVLTVRDMLACLKIPEEETAIIFINGRHGGKESAIRNGDMMAIFPPIGGG